MVIIVVIINPILVESGKDYPHKGKLPPLNELD
jgi:hypothetical protein